MLAYTRRVSLIVLSHGTATARTLGVPIREAEVHDGVAALREQLLPTSSCAPDLVVAHELALAYGRPDVVAAGVELAQWRAWRKRKVQPCTAPIPLGTALALSRLGGKATVDELVTSNGGQGSRSRVRRSLVALSDLGWVRRGGDAFELRLAPGQALLAVSGVEAKLNNWRRAVRQVQNWEGYVDATWLAFPAAYLRHVPRTPQLRRFGLIAVEGGQARIVRRPSGARANGVRHVLIEQHLYARWLAATQRKKARVPGRSGQKVRGRSRAARRER
jgi:hypothetical protein